MRHAPSLLASPFLVCCLLFFASFAGTTPVAQAEVLDITRACLPGFCVESREAFTVLAQDPARGRYRLLISKTQSVLYLQAGEAPQTPHCGALCVEREEAGERRLFHSHSGRLMGRLVGPFEGCSGASPFHVYAYVYFAEVSLARFSFVHACPARLP